MEMRTTVKFEFLDGRPGHMESRAWLEIDQEWERSHAWTNSMKVITADHCHRMVIRRDDSFTYQENEFGHQFSTKRFTMRA
jgi:hypothetical protein